MTHEIRLQVLFYKTETGKEPVRDWLKTLPPAEMKIIGQDIKTVQFGWPLGMPLVRKLDKELWEVGHTCLTVSLVSFLQLMIIGWFFYTVSSRNRKKHRLTIWR